MMDTLREILLCAATPTIVILSLVALGWIFRVDRKPRKDGRLGRFRGWLRLWWRRFILVDHRAE